MEKRLVISLLTVLTVMNVFAQKDKSKDFNSSVADITQRIDSLIQAKNKVLKANLDSIQSWEDRGEIDAKEANSQKRNLIKHYAEDLDYTIFKMTSDIKEFAQDKTEQTVIYRDDSREFSYTIRNLNNKKEEKEEKRKKKRTQSAWYFSIGLNNLIADSKINTLNDSPYKLWNSREFELGKQWKTSLTKKGRSVYVTYGLGVTWNTLKLTGNKYHLARNDSLVIVDFDYSVKQSKLRSVWMKVPLGMEFDIPGQQSKYLKINMGAYAKLKIRSKSKIKYYNEEGSLKVLKNKGNFNLNDFNYGLYSSIGGRDWSVYAQYDLLSFSKNGEANLLSMGVRWEW